MNHLLKIRNISLVFAIIFVYFFFFPFFTNQVSHAEYGEGSYCNAWSGGVSHPGTCLDRASKSCGTYYDSGNWCPGDDSVQCCVNSQVRCNTYTSSYCHNASAAGFGNQYNCGSVGGTFRSGYCPGPWDVQCCVVPQQPPPTNVTASCPAPGTTMTVNWTRPSGYTYSYARIYNETTGATCYSGVLSGTSYSCATTPGHQYSYWVHTTNSIGEPWSTEVPTAHGTKITCSTVPPTPTPTQTPTPTPTPTRFNQSTTTPGIVFTGDGTYNFGLGRASARDWVVGGLTYPEVYTRPGPSTISYQYLLDKIQNNDITITPISNYCSTTDCTLPGNLPRGVYRANGDLTLNAATFSDGNNYVFLVGRDLTLQDNITVANGTTVFFAANRDIIVPATVGAPTNTFPLPDAQIQGLFVANRNFTVQGIDNCVTGPDRMLNVEGAIVTNASGTGGTFTNNRDLCGDNLRYPSFTIRSRIDMLFNLPPVLLQQKTTIREDAP